MDLQAAVASAANQLEYLGDELDFADAAGAELDVVGHIAAGDFLADLRMQLTHRVDGAEIEILAEHERAGDRGQFIVALAGHRSRLDPGVALPLAPLGDEIVLQHVEAGHQRSRVAVRSQPHVYAEHLAVAGHFGERADQLAAELGEELEIADRVRPVGIAIVGIGEDQVDVG